MKSKIISISLALLLLGSAYGAGLEVKEVKRGKPVDFQNEILPILRNNCLACHNATDAESDLSLETPQTIAKGGSEGAVVVPGKPEMSALLLLASRQKESFMPQTSQLTPVASSMLLMNSVLGATATSGQRQKRKKFTPP